MMSPSYLLTKRGALKVIDDSYSVYELNKKSSKFISWRCENHYQGCKSTIRTTIESLQSTEPEIVSRSDNICEHPNDQAKVNARIAVADLKSRITEQNR